MPSLAACPVLPQEKYASSVHWHIFLVDAELVGKREGRAGTCPHSALIANWEVAAI